MDFTTFTILEMAGALEAQRAHDERQRKWLTLWRDLQHEARQEAAVVEATAPAPEALRPAA